MNRNETIQNRRESSTDIIEKIKTARDEARIKANAYRNLTAMEYDYWRAVSTALIYDETLRMSARATEHKIPGMATKAVAYFERVRDSETTEFVLAVLDGRRDALASVAGWMNTEEGGDS